jgi:hypothetical protein
MGFDNKERIRLLLEHAGYTIVTHHILDFKHNIFELTDNKFFAYNTGWTGWTSKTIHPVWILTKEQLIENIKSQDGFDYSWINLLDTINYINIRNEVIF